MKNISTRIEIRSAIITTEKLNKLFSYVEKLASEDNTNNKYSYIHQPSFSFLFKNRLEYNFDNYSEAKNILEDFDIKQIKEICCSYTGDSFKMRFNFNIGEYGDLSLSLDADDKGNLLSKQDDLLNIIKENSSNWIVNKGVYLFLISLTLIIILELIICLSFNPVNKFALFVIITILPQLIWIPIFALAPKIYPRFVLAQGNNRTGRLIAQDAWKVVGFLFILFITLIFNKYIGKFLGK